MDAKSANIARDGPWDREAGTAKISLGLLEGYLAVRASGEEKNSR